jgi:hypothetical protein
MGVFNRFSSKFVDDFARQLAQDISRRYPPAMDTGSRRRITVNRLTKLLEDSFTKARAFHREHRLGIYRKARLGNTFSWELRELGYSKEFVEMATEGMIVYLTKKDDKKTADGK